MPDYTGNLNLAKPIPNEDSADIRVINENMDKIDEWSTEINKKTKGATSEAAGIVKYGTDVSTALEGSKLAEILGIEYGGVLNNNNQKVAGKGYYDTANKKIYKCTTNTSINYADAGYFIEVSNNDLLGKLQNLNHYYYNSCIGGDLFNDSTEFNFKPVPVVVSSALKKFKVPYEGLYFITFSSRLSGDGSTKDVLIKIQKNDKDVAILPITTISSSVTTANYDDAALTVTCVLYLTTIDVVGLFTTQNKFNQQSLSICKLR